MAISVNPSVQTIFDELVRYESEYKPEGFNLNPPMITFVCRLYLQDTAPEEMRREANNTLTGRNRGTNRYFKKLSKHLQMLEENTTPNYLTPLKEYLKTLRVIEGIISPRLGSSELLYLTQLIKRCEDRLDQSHRLYN